MRGFFSEIDINSILIFIAQIFLLFQIITSIFYTGILLYIGYEENYILPEREWKDSCEGFSMVTDEKG